MSKIIPITEGPIAQLGRVVELRSPKARVYIEASRARDALPEGDPEAAYIMLAAVLWVDGELYGLDRVLELDILDSSPVFRDMSKVFSGRDDPLEDTPEGEEGNG